MSNAIIITVGGADTIQPGTHPAVYNGLSYTLDPTQRGRLSTPPGKPHNCQLNVTGSDQAIIKYNLSNSDLPGLRFAAIEWIGNDQLTSEVSGGTIKITDNETSSKKAYSFYIWFKDAQGVLKGRSKDPTIYNTGEGGHLSDGDATNSWKRSESLRLSNHGKRNQRGSTPPAIARSALTMAEVRSPASA